MERELKLLLMSGRQEKFIFVIHVAISYRNLEVIKNLSFYVRKHTKKFVPAYLNS
jgi:hypothetical protein